MAPPFLAPLPSPGLTLFPGYTAQKPESFMMKAQSLMSCKEKHLIYFLTSTGGPGAPFLEIKEEKRKHIMFKTMAGAEVMTIMKETHSWSGKSPEYHGMRPDGTEMWHLKLHKGLKGTDYKLTTFQTPYQSEALQVQNKVAGQDKAILLNGQPVAVMSNPDVWGHMRREDVIHVAPGMDILLALAVNWIRVDKQNMDAQAVVNGAL